MIYDILIALIFVLYVGITRWKFGKLESISATYYYLGKGWGNLIFTLFCWSMAILLVVGHVEQNFIFDKTDWFYIPSIFLFMLGGAPGYKDQFIEKWHLAGAIGGIVTAAACIIIVYNSWWTITIFIVISSSFYLSNLQDKTWWVEIMAFVGIIVGLFIK